jgi:hypothetical protein
VKIQNALFTRLMELRNSTGRAHHERLCIARDLLIDKEWVAENGGSVGKALDYLEDVCFADLCGSVQLPQLLDLLTAYPSIAQWGKHKFNFRAMWAEHSAKKKPKPTFRNTTPRPVKTLKDLVDPISFAQLPPFETKREYGKVYHLAEKTESEVDRLLKANEDLINYIHELEAELMKYKTIYGKLNVG